MSASEFQSLYVKWTKQGEAGENEDSILKCSKEE